MQHSIDPRALVDDLLEADGRRQLLARSARPCGAGCSRGRRRQPTPWPAGPCSSPARRPGLGRQVTDELAAVGARVILVGRNAERLTAVRDALVARHGVDRFPIVVADMGSLASVRAAADRGPGDRVAPRRPHRQRRRDLSGADDRARTASRRPSATLVVGPFALIGGLLPLLARTPGSRVIAVTSGGQYAQAIDLDDLEYCRGAYDGTRAYARAKRAQVSLIREWARRLGAAGIRFNSMHPGWADTPGLSEALPGFARLMGPLLRTPARGHRHAGLAGDRRRRVRRRRLDRSGSTAGRARSTGCPMTRLSSSDRRRLWDLVVALSGLPDPSHLRIHVHSTPALEATHDHARASGSRRPCPSRTTFAYVADFANSRSGTRASPRLSASMPGPIGLGSRFRLGVRLGGRASRRWSTGSPSSSRRPGSSSSASGSGVSAVDEIRLRAPRRRHAGRLHGRHPARRDAPAGPALPRARLREPRRGTPSTACSGRSTQRRGDGATAAIDGRTRHEGRHRRGRASAA